ncbi:hypothetical protein ACH6EH_05265 [Paenibacillus sp. JSM ZJ436]|uniref:hypothetical protein n=1 Tax=Paenibacillus sp. JSM ZJ436 TaxID=3376190 RepID=UPI00378E1163
MYCMIFCSLALLDWYLLRRSSGSPQRKRSVTKMLWFMIPLFGWNAAASQLEWWPNPFDLLNLVLGWVNLM